MELELNKNYKELSENKLYHQKNGAAIRNKAASSYAHIFMYFYGYYLYACITQFLWLRYFDDIFCIWAEVEEKIKELKIKIYE